MRGSRVVVIHTYYVSEEIKQNEIVKKMNEEFKCVHQVVKRMKMKWRSVRDIYILWTKYNVITILFERISHIFYTSGKGCNIRSTLPILMLDCNAI